MCGGDITKREHVYYRVPIGTVYSWIHVAMNQNGVNCITPEEYSRRLGAAAAVVAAARRGR